MDAFTLYNTVSRSSLNLSTSNQEIVLINNGLIVDPILVVPQTYTAHGAIGSTLTSKNFSTRIISLTGWVIGSSQDRVDFLKRQVTSVINPRDLIELRYKGYKLNVYFDEHPTWGVDVKTNNEQMSKFLVYGTCYNPLWEDEIEEVLSSASKLDNLEFDFEIPEDGLEFSFFSESLTIDVNNLGDLESGFVVDFVARGELENPELIDLSTQKFLKFNIGLNAGEILRVDTEAKTALKYTNGVWSNAYNFRDFQSSWLSNKVGFTRYRRQASSESGLANLEVNLRRKNKYFERY